MSRTLDEAERTVRYHLRDRNPQSEAFTSPEYFVALQSGVRVMAGELLLGESVTTSFLTLVAGTSDYVLPGTQQYRNLYELRSQDDGRIIPIVSSPVLESYRQGDVGIVSDNGGPLYAALSESTAQVLTLRVWPTPGQSEVLDGRYSQIPAGFYTAGTGALAALPGATVIPFDDHGFEALCWSVAALMFEAMPDDKKAKLGLSQNAASSWPGLSAQQVKASRHRVLTTGRGQHTHIANRRRW